MGKIMKSGIEYSGGSSSGDSKKIKYDNTNSGLESTNVQDAIDEITGSGKILNLQTTLLLDNITNESYTSYGADISYSNYYIEVSIQGSVSLPFYIMNMEVGKKYRCAFAANVYIDLEFKEDKVYISIAKGNYESIYVSIYGIQGISTTGAEVVDNLESTDSEAALSANMGRELLEQLEEVDISENLLTINGIGKSIIHVTGRKRRNQISISFTSTFDAAQLGYVAQITNPDFCPNYQTAISAISMNSSGVWYPTSGFILDDGRIYFRTTVEVIRTCFNIQFNK